MTIGVFDSGVGGLTIHRALTGRFPAADFVYLADQAHMPYGPRSGAEIVALTLSGTERLFVEGCDLVILACNTASAVALRQLQHDWLPGARARHGRHVNVLGIIVPTIEVATGRPWHRADAHRYPASIPVPNPGGSLGVFATRATARSEVYAIEIAKRRPDLAVITEPCPHLAALIEAGAGLQELTRVIDVHAAAMLRGRESPPDSVVLGSTHYEVVAEVFRRALPPQTQLIQQPAATANALRLYLARHPEYAPGTSGVRRFLTTGEPGAQNSLVEGFWGAPLTFERA